MGLNPFQRIPHPRLCGFNLVAELLIPNNSLPLDGIRDYLRKRLHHALAFTTEIVTKPIVSGAFN